MSRPVRLRLTASALAILAIGCSLEQSGKEVTEAPARTTEPPTKVAPMDAAALEPARPDVPATAPAPETTVAAPETTVAAPKTQTRAAKPVPEPNEGPPKNLKVLPKSWSRDKVEEYMKQHVAEALGVKCKHCHDREDLAKDGNEHKAAARAMIRMQRQINDEFFEGKSRVSCMTCHMGKEKPAGGE